MAQKLKLTADVLAEAKRLRNDEGLSIQEISKRVLVSKTRLHAALRGEPMPRGRPSSPVKPTDTGRPGEDGAGQPAPNQAAARPREKLEQLHGLVARLSLRQQDHVVTGLRIDTVRRDAIARALARHPDAAKDVARTLRALEI